MKSRPTVYRFMTLTLRSSDAPLRQQVRDLIQSFRRLRQNPRWKEHVRGGVFFVELTRNTTTDRWHPHLHIICHGSYYPVQHLSDDWRRASKGSFIVNVKLANGSNVVSYVSKYAGKGVSLVGDHLLAAEQVFALQGVRLFSTFGDWRGQRLSERPQPDNPDEQWETFSTLAYVLSQARNGDLRALAILCQIRHADPTPSAETEAYTLEDG